MAKIKINRMRRMSVLTVAAAAMLAALSAVAAPRGFVAPDTSQLPGFQPLDPAATTGATPPASKAQVTPSKAGKGHYAILRKADELAAAR